MRRPSHGMAALVAGAALVLTASSGPLAAFQVARGGADARTEYRQLDKEFQAALEEFETEVARLEEAGDEVALDAYRVAWSPRPAFAELFAERAEAYAGTEEAVPFLTWILKEGPIARRAEGGALSPEVEGAIDTLIRDHAENPSFTAVLEYFGYTADYGDKTRSLVVLESLMEKASTEELVLRARLARGIAYVSLSERTPEEEGIGRGDLAHVRDAGAGTPLAEEASAYLFELDNLQIGCTAPDIEGADLDGVEFKLSDYRGKVVVLDFWGDW